MIRKTEETLDVCGLAKLTPLLKLENGVITPTMFDTENTRATATCNRMLAALGAQTTRSIETMLRACTPVETVILTVGPPPGDPLGFRGRGLSTLGDIVGLVCGDALTAGFTAWSDKGPRAINVGPGDPNVVSAPIDPRCF